EQSQRVGPGPYWVIVRDYGNNFGSFDLRVEPPLWIELVGGTRVPLGREKDGDLSALFATALSLPPTPIIPGLIDGFLLVDLNTGLVVGTQTVPADGSLTWITLPPGFGGYLQSLTFHLGAFPARFSDVVQ